MKCWICNEDLIWGGDHDFDEDETHFDGQYYGDQSIMP